MRAMLLPDLRRLALLHAHEEEEPTGVLDSAIDKTKKRISLAQWKARRREAVRPQLEGLPLELRLIVTE